MATLNVRNEQQRILLEEELKGQISDGMWENARPDSHWIVWCDATVVVDPENVGRDFYARKDNYNLTAPLLLEIVGDRMVEAVQAGGFPDYDRKQMVADLKDLKVIMKTRAGVVA